MTGTKTIPPTGSHEQESSQTFRVVGTKAIGQIVMSLKKGLTVGIYDAFVRKSGLSQTLVNDVIQLRSRTLVRRRKEGRLSPVESERLYRLSVVFEKAVELHEGDTESARTWMTTPRSALSGQTPLTMCETEVGAQEVQHLIGRLEHGVFS